MAKVIITGCGLHISPDYMFWGDLWEEGDCWVFNACGSEEGEAVLEPHQKILFVDGHEYFQRRNVFVIQKGASHLNITAQRYLE